MQWYDDLWKKNCSREAETIFFSCSLALSWFTAITNAVLLQSNLKKLQVAQLASYILLFEFAGLISMNLKQFLYL